MVVNPSSPSGPTSLSLLERVRSHDQTAWERLVALYGPLVYSWGRRAGLQPADAADVGQEVFLAVARAIDSFRHDFQGATFRGWLFSITRNKLRDRSARLDPVGLGGSEARKRLDELAQEEASSVGPESRDAAAEETRALYRRAIESVRAEFELHTWEAFWRVVVDEQAAADVASALGMSVNAVYLAKSRVLRRLREEFAALLDFDPGCPA